MGVRPEPPSKEQVIEVMAVRNDDIKRQVFVFTENEIWRLVRMPKTAKFGFFNSTPLYHWIKVW